MSRLSSVLVVSLWVLGVGSGKVLAKGPGAEVVYSPDGSLLAVGSPTQLTLFTLPSLMEARVLQVSPPVVFSPDGQRLIAGKGNRVVSYDLRSGQAFLELQEHQFQVTSLAVKPDGSLIASGGLDGAVYLWDMREGYQINLFESRGNFTVESLAFNREGTLLSALINNHTLPVWDVQTHAQVVILKGSFTGTVAFSPDSQWLAVGRDQRLDGELRDEIVLWDTYSWEPQATLAGHTGQITAVSFSPDGRWLASASSDSTVRLWEVSSFAEVGVFRGHSEPVARVSFSPDGHVIASVNGMGGVLLWEWESAQTAVGQRSWGSLKAGDLRR